MKCKKQLLKTYLKGLITRKYTLRQAAESTGYTIQYLSVLKKKYLKFGESIFVHQHTGKQSHNRIPNETRKKIAEIYSLLPDNLNYKFFYEYLSENYPDIKVSYNSIRTILKEYGYYSPEIHRYKKQTKVHRPRFRRRNEGDLVQIDGTPYEWFKLSNKDHSKYCMHGAIDDATGKILSLYITDNECIFGYTSMLKQILIKYGVPREIYSDRAAIFCATPKSVQQLTIQEQLEGLHEERTQWQRMLKELNINQILAWSPQAKGRVERMWHTLQARLPFIFYQHRIKNKDMANRFLEKWVDEFNNQFAIQPASQDNFFLPCENENLTDILCLQFDRKTNANGVFSFQKFGFAIENAKYVACKKIKVCISENGIYAKMLDNLYYPVKIVSYPKNWDGSTIQNKIVTEIVHSYLFSYAKENCV